MTRPRLFLLAGLWLTAAALAACQPAVLPATPAPAQPAATVTPAPAAPSPTVAPDPAALCPQPGPDQAAYLSRENGFCFVYPAYFEAGLDEVRPETTVALRGPVEIAGQEGIAATLWVAFNGPADGLDSAAYAARWRQFFYYGSEPATEAIHLNGRPAALIRNVPGAYASQWAALVVADDWKYQVRILPEPGTSAALDEHVRLAWDTVTQSLVFFPPAAPRPATRPAEVCPTAGPDTVLWVDEPNGMCFLYPAGYGPDPDFAGRLIGGPVLADTVDWGQVRISIAIASYDQPAAALEQALTPPTEQVDPASIRAATFGGAPAIVYDFTGGPWRQRTVSLVARGSVYTMVGPWDAQAFPGSEAETQRLWETVTGSIAFFDKWR